MEQKQIVLITGRNTVIDHGLAKAFIAKGADVAAFGRSAKALEDFSHEFPHAPAIRADVTYHWKD